jgi:hypothetical protein
MSKIFTYTDALHLVMAVIYPDDEGGYVRRLTANQRNLLSQYPPDGSGPSDLRSRAEWERAKHLDRLARLQRERAVFWLSNSGFPSERWFEGLDPEVLKKQVEDTLARDFSPNAVPQQPVALLKLGGFPAHLRRRLPGAGTEEASTPVSAEGEEIVKPSAEANLDSPPNADQVADEPAEPRSPVGVDIASSPAQQATDLGEASGKKQPFIEWAEAEKSKHGSYPPLQANYNSQRDNVRAWATRNGVTRSIAEGWAKDEGFARRRGRPSSRSGSNN